MAKRSERTSAAAASRPTRTAKDTEHTLREEIARAAALHVFTRLGVTDPEHIDLDAIAAELNAEIVFDDLEGATARVIQLGDRARIIVSNRIVDVGSIRFSIAHEIGHILCKHQVAPRKGVERHCSPLEPAGKATEREADVFAAELLMPTPLVTPWCSVEPSTFEPIRAIARAFGTSVLASAIRFVELTPHCCAIVYSRHGRIQWAKRSTEFKGWIPRRSLAPGSVAFEYFERGTLDEASRVVPSAAWLASRAGTHTCQTTLERACAVPQLGAVVSLLWMPQPDRALPTCSR